MPVLYSTLSKISRTKQKITSKIYKSKELESIFVEIINKINKKLITG